ncbi:nitrate ABC transporter permease [Pusillimonas sp. SM2304]|uniref:nitrate ABC transporter permease n=1 Tax=Pusillimonas sp. SM2304 TaxID=3073241 RepID=UPI0028754B4B|nr:nitrate ABC transporter permease [Pusillimonas sp. SM2304]MDS1139793.1 nitrate ABC transporter permease [Pusillimonas sp. SM2304]
MNLASSSFWLESAKSWRAGAGRLACACAGPLVGFALLLIVWKVISMRIADIPAPESTLLAAFELFKHPFYDNGPNDVGIGWNILASLSRVAIGFALAALVGIPAGFLIGRVPVINAICSPVINLLRPISPLAWLPLGLLLFKAAGPAAIWAIFICSIWPMIINTADGVRRVPQDYLNVARVLNLSEWNVFTRILLPSALPYMMTGVRLSIGTAWLVIVAAEMLTGGTGLGFWLWDEWNNLNVQNILIAVLVIGVIGLILDLGLLAAARRLDHSET